MKLVIALLVFTSFAVAHVYDKCELSSELLRLGFPRGELQDWICLINSESSFDSRVKGGPNSDGSYDWGLWQINDRYWCRVGFAGGDCNIDCNDLIDDNIDDDAVCAKLIHSRHGFWAWYGWQAKCQGADKPPSIADCNL